MSNNPGSINSNNAENDAGGSGGGRSGLPSPPPAVRVFTINDLRAQSAFLRWYMTSLRQHWQTDADGQFGRTLALCGGLAGGEPNVLGVARLVELFGEDVVREQALKAVQLSGQVQAAVLEQTGRAERTIGGILFYLVRQHYCQLQPSQPAQQPPSLQVSACVSEAAVVSHTQAEN
jgi:hypothetical protein